MHMDVSRSRMEEWIWNDEVKIKASIQSQIPIVSLVNKVWYGQTEQNQNKIKWKEEKVCHDVTKWKFCGPIYTWRKRSYYIGSWCVLVVLINVSPTGS